MKKTSNSQTLRALEKETSKTERISLRTTKAGKEMFMKLGGQAWFDKVLREEEKKAMQ